MTDWKNLKAIQRDLIRAQGYIAIDIVKTVGSNDRPPVEEFLEETEEEYFKYCTGDADYNTAPELDLIKDMLDLVKESDVAEEDVDSEDLVISKLNSNTAEFVPQIVIPKRVAKVRKSRNAAMASLLEAIGESKPDPIVKPTQVTCLNNKRVPEACLNNVINNQEVNGDLSKKTNEKGPRFEHKSVNSIVKEGIAILSGDNKSKPDIKLSKPVDFLNNDKKPSVATNKDDLNKNGSVDVVSKVNKWLTTQHKDSIMLNPSNMFKKKNVVKPASKCESPNSPSMSEKSYKPSVLANEYYQIYMERNKVKEEIEQDIWTKAENQMKEIDAKRKLEAEQVATTSPSTSSSSTTQKQECDDEDVLGPDAYKLPFHRHIWDDDCVVCEMMEKHKYDVKSMKLQPELLEEPSFFYEKEKQPS